MKRLAILGTLVLLINLLAVPATPAQAATTLVVDDNGADCPGAAYTTIQAAVNAAAAGDTVRVCNGTYTEQVTITTSNLRLRSANALGATIKAPSSMVDPKAIVRISGATGVTIEGFTISGPGGGTCNSLRFGVRVDGAGSATIRNNRITAIRDNPASGCQNGVGIPVGRNFESTTGKAIIRDNIIDDYQKGGIVVDNAGSSATISENTITGFGPVNFIGQNGIQVSRGAMAKVEENRVSGHWYTPATVTSTGWLVFLSNGVVVKENRSANNQTGVYLQGDGNNAKENKIDPSTWGIILWGNGNKASENKVTCVDIGVDVYGNNNLVKENKIRGQSQSSPCQIGILLEKDTGVGVGNVLKENKFENVVTEVVDPPANTPRVSPAG